MAVCVREAGELWHFEANSDFMHRRWTSNLSVQFETLGLLPPDERSGDLPDFVDVTVGAGGGS